MTAHDKSPEETAENPGAGFQRTSQIVQRIRALTLKLHPAIPEQTNIRDEATTLPQPSQRRRH